MDNALAVHDFVGVLHGVQGRFDLGSRHDKPRLAFFRGVRVPETCIVRREVLEVSFLYELRPFTSTVRVVTRHRAGAVTTTGELRTLLEALNEPVHLLAIAKNALRICCTAGSHPERPS